MSVEIDFQRARFNMIEQQIRPWNVLDPKVLETLGTLKRDEFVPSALKHLAYIDTELPLPEGQSMLSPKVEARLLQELQLQASDDVLEIGSGSGFMAALMSRLARWVTTLEMHAALVEMATINLRHAQCFNTAVVHEDGSQHNGTQQYDAIVLSGSVAQAPLAWLARLKPGGRMAVIVGQEPVMRAQIITRTSDANFQARDLFDTVAPRLRGFGEASAFHF